MNGKTHIALGLAAAVALGYDPLTAPVTITTVLVARTLLPDLDHRNGASPLRRPLPRPLQWLARLPSAVLTHRGPCTACSFCPHSCSSPNTALTLRPTAARRPWASSRTCSLMR
ncbi:MAG: metal-dependent hydrolase [Anaerolineae bacterium]|nr:metal-dependent hydrolase [Anaerolineae bacterium]